MLYPTINKLTKGKFNRYQLAVATAKCARIITDEYVRERHLAEKAAMGIKETDRPADAIVNPDYRDRKAVKIAIDKIESGEYVIVDRDENGNMTVGEDASLMVSAHQANAVPAKSESGNEEPVVVTEATLPEEKFPVGPAADKVNGDYEEEGDWDTMSEC